jgi:DNA polymerase IV
VSTPFHPDRFAFLHIDLNSFFASVEQQLHPEYRGKPLAVVPTMADTTVCIAASYEAKAFNVKTGTQVGEAKKLCPGIILVSGDHADYAKYSHDITEAVELACPVSHNPSIDEMVCQLMGREQEPPRARQIALNIKQSIYKNVGVALRCSIGMAPNRYLAKIASDMQKPDGLIGLLPSQLPRAIAHLDLRALPGVGARTEIRLNKKGITTMEQLLALDHNQMGKLFDSVWGNRMYHWLRGAQTEDASGNNVSNPEVQKSLGHSHVLAPEHRSPEGSWAVAHKLLHKAAMRLQWSTSTPAPSRSPSATSSRENRPTA